uniref:Uncharacterized protein n=1 Tax=Oryza brachyantha TaxID=4533 RepID=J3LFR1_ORYBR
MAVIPQYPMASFSNDKSPDMVMCLPPRKMNIIRIRDLLRSNQKYLKVSVPRATKSFLTIGSS